MNLDRVPSRKEVPNACNVVIEIPMRGDPIRYEVHKLPARHEASSPGPES